MKDSKKNEAEQLRRRAEDLIGTGCFVPDIIHNQDMAQLIHDLQVYQAELEIQNEDLKQIQKELILSRDRFSSFFHQAPVGYLLLNSEGMVLDANETFCTMIGQKIPSIKGKGFSQFLIEADRALFLARYRALFKQPEGKRLEARLFVQNGAPVHVRMEARILKGEEQGKQDEDGRKLIMNLINIDAQKQAEEKNAAYNRKLEHLYHQLEEEVKKAKSIHERTLPASIPSIEGLSIATYYQPATMLGGDSYNFIKEGDKLVIYFSDVMGHGLDGAMLSVFVKEAIDSYASLKPEDLCPGKVLHHLDRQYRRERFPEEYMICIFVAVLNLETMVLAYSGAGFQTSPLVQFADGERIKLSSKGLPILTAINPELNNFQVKRIRLAPGATILFSTDGLPELNNQGELYSGRLENIFFENAYLPPHLIVQEIKEDFYYFNEHSLHTPDDITFGLLQVNTSEEKNSPEIKKET